MSDRDAPSKRSVEPWEWTIFGTLFFGFAWSIVSQFYDPSAGSYLSFPMPSIGGVIELGIIAIAMILTVGYRHRLRSITD